MFDAVVAFRGELCRAKGNASMDIEELQTFVEVADAGGISQAALRLGVSKSIVSRRLVRLEAELGGTWTALYDFEHHAPPAIDYEVGNWYTATHPASHFTHQLMVARTTVEARYALGNNRLTIRRTDGSTRPSRRCGRTERRRSAALGCTQRQSHPAPRPHCQPGHAPHDHGVQGAKRRPGQRPASGHEGALQGRAVARRLCADAHCPGTVTQPANRR